MWLRIFVQFEQGLFRSVQLINAMDTPHTMAEKSTKGSHKKVQKKYQRTVIERFQHKIYVSHLI